MELVEFSSPAMDQPVNVAVVRNHQFSHHKMDRSSTCASKFSLAILYWDSNYQSHVNIYILFVEIPISSLTSYSFIGEVGYIAFGICACPIMHMKVHAS